MSKDEFFTIGTNLYNKTTPEILIPALRQYQHNRPTGELFAGFDYDETCKIVSVLQRHVEKLEAAYQSLERQIKRSDLREWMTEKNAKVKQLEAENAQLKDEHHTIDELYSHRHALYLFLLCVIGGWKSKLHEDGTMFDGWFISGIDLEDGPISYHLPIELWSKAKAQELDKAPPWDGYTPEDVIERLLNQIESPMTYIRDLTDFTQSIGIDDE